MVMVMVVVLDGDPWGFIEPAASCMVREGLSNRGFLAPCVIALFRRLNFHGSLPVAAVYVSVIKSFSPLLLYTFVGVW